MCGIAGAVNWGDESTLVRMTDVQHHRGPDDGGTWSHTTPTGDWIGLGSRRLAILDLSPAGHMPMSTPDGLITIVYNGEIYNFPQLRNELEAQGCVFRSHSDTEAILFLYERLGTECFKRLNGMFALAIWDKRNDSLVLARDHFGIKPLYYTTRGNRLAFASELKALLELPDVPREIDPFALQQYLTMLWTPDPRTMLRGIAKLPAGHFAVFRNGALSIEQYWDLKYPPANHVFRGDERALADELRERFGAVVRSQMLSDVPLGAFLSAGLDSSAIVASMAAASPLPVRTFTIAFPESYRRGEVHLDDPDVAARTAKHFGCAHTHIVVEPDVIDLLPKLVWHMDEPTADPAIVMAYLVSREARRDVTVLLSGIGGDELFAGYRKYRAHELAETYRRVPRFVREGIIRRGVQALPAMRGSRFKGYVRLAKKMVRSGSLPPIDRFLMDSVYLTDEMQRELIADGGQRTADSMVEHRRYFGNVADADFINQMMYVDTKTFMVSLNLNYNDKMSMASSVETRVPFLDWEFAEWAAWNIDPRLKLHDGTTKHILREAMRGVLPEEVIRQKKASFGAPSDYWLANELREMVDDLLSESAIRRRGYFDPAPVRRMIEEQRRGRADWSAQIWQFLTFELWLRTFMDR